jgi:putative SOS response-associated peptidase YedK
MCGKFTQMLAWREVVRLSGLIGARINDEVVVCTPMRMVPVIHLDAVGRRVITPMTWSFTDRKPQGARIPKHMHARGETVDRLPTFRDAFHERRAIVLARTFNEGQEIEVADDDAAPAGRKWVRQWTIHANDPKPFISGVVFDTFDVGRGAEYEFVQVTTSANAVVSTITDRMPLMLHEEDLPVWLGEVKASIDVVKALIRTWEDCTDWETAVEDPTRKPPRPRKTHPKQGELF